MWENIENSGIQELLFQSQRLLMFSQCLSRITVIPELILSIVAFPLKILPFQNVALVHLSTFKGVLQIRRWNTGRKPSAAGRTLLMICFCPIRFCTSQANQPSVGVLLWDERLAGLWWNFVNMSRRPVLFLENAAYENLSWCRESRDKHSVLVSWIHQMWSLLWLLKKKKKEALCVWQCDALSPVLHHESPQYFCLLQHVENI